MIITIDSNIHGLDEIVCDSLTAFNFIDIERLTRSGQIIKQAEQNNINEILTDINKSNTIRQKLKDSGQKIKPINHYIKGSWCEYGCVCKFYDKPIENAIIYNTPISKCENAASKFAELKIKNKIIAQDKNFVGDETKSSNTNDVEDKLFESNEILSFVFLDPTKINKKLINILFNLFGYNKRSFADIVQLIKILIDKNYSLNSFEKQYDEIFRNVEQTEPLKNVILILDKMWLVYKGLLPAQHMTFLLSPNSVGVQLKARFVQSLIRNIIRYNAIPTKNFLSYIQQISRQKNCTLNVTSDGNRLTINPTTDVIKNIPENERFLKKNTYTTRYVNIYNYSQYMFDILSYTIIYNRIKEVRKYIIDNNKDSDNAKNVTKNIDSIDEFLILENEKFQKYCYVWDDVESVEPIDDLEKLINVNSKQ